MAATGPPDPLERFALEIRALRDPDGVPPAIRVKQWLKVGLRRFYLRAAIIDPAACDPGELQRLRQLVNAMAKRIADQAELLARRAGRRKATAFAPPPADHQAPPEDAAP